MNNAFYDWCIQLQNIYICQQIKISNKPITKNVNGLCSSVPSTFPCSSSPPQTFSFAPSLAFFAFFLPFHFFLSFTFLTPSPLSLLFFHLLLSMPTFPFPSFRIWPSICLSKFLSRVSVIFNSLRVHQWRSSLSINFQQGNCQNAEGLWQRRISQLQRSRRKGEERLHLFPNQKVNEEGSLRFHCRERKLQKRTQLDDFFTAQHYNFVKFSWSFIVKKTSKSLLQINVDIILC